MNIVMLTLLIAKGPPAHLSILVDSLELFSTITEKSTPPCTKESPTPPPTKAASMVISQAEIFSLEELLLAAMVAPVEVAAVPGMAMMQNQVFTNGCTCGMYSFLCQEYFLCCGQWWVLVMGEVWGFLFWVLCKSTKSLMVLCSYCWYGRKNLLHGVNHSRCTQGRGAGVWSWLGSSWQVLTCDSEKKNMSYVGQRYVFLTIYQQDRHFMTCQWHVTNISN